MLQDSQRQIIRAGSKPSLESWPIRAQNNKLNQQQQAKDCECGEVSRERARKGEKPLPWTVSGEGRREKQKERERKGNMDRLSERDRMSQSYWALHWGMPVGKSVIMSRFAFFPPFLSFTFSFCCAPRLNVSLLPSSSGSSSSRESPHPLPSFHIQDQCPWRHSSLQSMVPFCNPPAAHFKNNFVSSPS